MQFYRFSSTILSIWDSLFLATFVWNKYFRHWAHWQFISNVFCDDMYPHYRVRRQYDFATFTFLYSQTYQTELWNTRMLLFTMLPIFRTAICSLHSSNLFLLILSSIKIFGTLSQVVWCWLDQIFSADDHPFCWTCAAKGTGYFEWLTNAEGIYIMDTYSRSPVQTIPRWGENEGICYQAIITRAKYLHAL